MSGNNIINIKSCFCRGCFNILSGNIIFGTFFERQSLIEAAFNECRQIILTTLLIFTACVTLWLDYQRRRFCYQRSAVHVPSTNYSIIKHSYTKSDLQITKMYEGETMSASSLKTLAYQLRIRSKRCSDVSPTENLASIINLIKRGAPQQRGIILANYGRDQTGRPSRS